MSELAKGRLRSKRADLTKALEGRVESHHRFILTELLCQIDSLDETIEHFEEQIAERCHPFEEVVVHLDTITGIGSDLAQAIVAEIGTDMTRFGTAARLSAWAGVCCCDARHFGDRVSSDCAQRTLPRGGRRPF